MWAARLPKPRTGYIRSIVRQAQAKSERRGHKSRAAFRANEPQDGGNWMWEPGPGRPLFRQEHVVARLPTLAHGLGVTLDLKDAFQGILGGPRRASA